MAKRDETAGDNGGDRNISRAEIGAAVQLSLAMCATCGHVRGDHPEDLICRTTWKTGEGTTNPVEHKCHCQEYWPVRQQREDGMRVIEHEVSFGGSVGLQLDRRVPTEFWDGLSQGKTFKLTTWVTVEGKGFKPKRADGVTIGLIESKKLVASHVEFEQVPDGAQ